MVEKFEGIVKGATEIVWLDRVIHWIFHDKIGPEELIALFGAFYGHESFDHARGQIRNFRSVSSIEMEGNAVQVVQKIAAFDRAAAISNPYMKVAVVTPDDIDHKMLASLYGAELYGSPWQVEIFDCEEAAKRWIK